MKIEEFVKYLEYIKGYSAHTLRAYTIDLQQFEQFVNGCIRHSNDIKTDLEKDVKILRLWIMELKKNNISNRSIDRKITSLRSYFSWTLRDNPQEMNPMDKIINLKIAKRQPSFIEQNDITKVLFMDYKEDDFISFRNFLIIVLLYALGIRRTELLELKDDSILFNYSTISVIGKGDKQRIIPLSQQIIDLLRKYIDLKTRLDINNNEERYLFVDKKGMPLTGSQLYYLVHKRLLSIDLHKRSPHVLRHTFATDLINNGANIINVRDLLGHTSLAATEVYTHVTIEDLKKEYNRSFE